MTSENTSRTEGVDKVPGSVDSRFAAGLPSPVPQILECRAFRDSGNSFPELYGRETPQKTPETATAFSSFLIFRSVKTERVELERHL